MIFRDCELANYLEDRQEANRIIHKMRQKMIKDGVTQCRCERCNEDTPLREVDIHHLVPIAAGGSSRGDVVTLCRKCHYAVHGMVYDPASLIIDDDEWEIYAEKNMTYDQIAKLYDVRRHVVRRTWEKSHPKQRWSNFKKKYRKEV